MSHQAQSFTNSYGETRWTVIRTNPATLHNGRQRAAGTRSTPRVWKDKRAAQRCAAEFNEMNVR